MPFDLSVANAVLLMMAGSAGMICATLLMIREFYYDGIEVEMRRIYLLAAGFIGCLIVALYGLTL
jgi:hypothetical protein